jgi:hypothetical protein
VQVVFDNGFAFDAGVLGNGFAFGAGGFWVRFCFGWVCFLGGYGGLLGFVGYLCIYFFN